MSGLVMIIDTDTYKEKGRIEFEPKGLRRDEVTPVDIVMTKDGKTLYAALGRANHVAVVDTATRAVREYYLVGKRPWGLRLNKDETKLYVANGLSDDLAIIDTTTGKTLKTIPVGIVPYGILIDE
jgi:YVTN family beta-propeller protein